MILKLDVKDRNKRFRGEGKKKEKKKVAYQTNTFLKNCK